MTFRFVDEVLSVEPGEYGKIVTVTVIPPSLPYLTGPFRSAGVPPSLVLESLAQSAGHLVLATYPRRGVLLIKVEEAQFHRPLGGGERLTVRSELQGFHGDPEAGGVARASVEAAVDGAPVAEARLLFLVVRVDGLGVPWEELGR
jgi:3-hydroxymyristoyl/3-hydroxydecanoyl-(acyl carrier protein) dehydratase